MAVAPTFGSLSFTTVTADFRKYLMPVRPLTIAMRVMHVGRYGSGADDPRLLPLAWTLRDLVRGYGDTGPVAGDTSYLTAPRLLVANVEARFPIPGIFTGNAEPLGLPIEGLIFSDAGQFWIPVARDDSARPILRSYGARRSYHRSRVDLRVRRGAPRRSRSGVARLEVRVQLPAGFLAALPLGSFGRA